MWIFVFFEIAIALVLVLSVLWVLRPRAGAGDLAEGEHKQDRHEHE